MHLAHLPAALVNGADFRLQHEQRPGPRGAPSLWCSRKVQRFRLHSQPVEAGFFIQNKLFGKFGAPLRVGKVARAKNVNALAARPGGKMPGVERLAGGPRKT